jgi:hypothetical protein
MWALIGQKEHKPNAVKLHSMGMQAQCSISYHRQDKHKILGQKEQKANGIKLHSMSTKVLHLNILAQKEQKPNPVKFPSRIKHTGSSLSILAQLGQKAQWTKMSIVYLVEE